MTQGNDCVHLAWGRDKQVTARTTVGGECHVICTLTRTVFDDGSIYDKLDGRQTIVCYYFSLRLLKVLVISVHIQSVLRWFIPPWQSHDKQTICQASRPYLVFASHSYRDKDCVTKVVWLSERAAPGGLHASSTELRKWGKWTPFCLFRFARCRHFRTSFPY